MPLHQNQDGTWQWGKSGKKYKKKQDAVKQMKAIFANGYVEKHASYFKTLNTPSYSDVLGMIKTASDPVIGNKPAYVSRPTVPELYDIIAHQQTGSYPDPWIRTKVNDGKIHTNFGKVQLGIKLKDTPKRPLTELDKLWLQNLRTQRLLFASYDPKTDDPAKWGPGGKGLPQVWENENSQKAYRRIGEAYIGDLHDSLSKLPFNSDQDAKDYFYRVAKNWYGNDLDQENRKYGNTIYNYWKTQRQKKPVVQAKTQVPTTKR